MNIRVTSNQVIAKVNSLLRETGETFVPTDEPSTDILCTLNQWCWALEEVIDIGVFFE